MFKYSAPIACDGVVIYVILLKCDLNAVVAEEAFKRMVERRRSYVYAAASLLIGTVFYEVSMHLVGSNERHEYVVAERREGSKWKLTQGKSLSG